ncbi:protein of unknown function [Candidatus Nitrosocosmicus franklandus]|uniref:Uncharacterized protein n=1 Tax=Candidatus Nitrosocosmicus franklandianus TaxID=1798806 RepID=A0A484I9I3_9ARCH|nr:protein of unknown function [Candidatus Nitrosocosmicus franklandus]
MINMLQPLCGAMKLLQELYQQEKANSRITNSVFYNLAVILLILWLI